MESSAAVRSVAVGCLSVVTECRARVIYQTRSRGLTGNQVQRSTNEQRQRRNTSEGCSGGVARGGGGARLLLLLRSVSFSIFTLLTVRTQTESVTPRRTRAPWLNWTHSCFCRYFWWDSQPLVWLWAASIWLSAAAFRLWQALVWWEAWVRFCCRTSARSEDTGNTQNQTGRRKVQDIRSEFVVQVS